LDINERIKDYLRNPFPLWNVELAKILVDKKWDLSLKNIFQNREDYSIKGCVLKDGKQKERTCLLSESENKLQIAFPSDSLSSFYKKHGLVTTDINISFPGKVEKINNALNILGKVTHLKSFVFQLVNSIQIIEPENADTDISYSHPNIPFSIFFSLCEEKSIISDLRVAESILHETMHLMLTLIENQYDLIVPGSKETFFSPWRDEQRPLRGVLHGLFVFRAMLELYNILKKLELFADINEYIECRIIKIEDDINSLKEFAAATDLTTDGAILTIRLLPLN
jgi:hypothetical protein